MLVNPMATAKAATQRQETEFIVQLSFCVVIGNELHPSLFRRGAVRLIGNLAALC